MIVWPPQIALWIVGTVITLPSSAIGPGCWTWVVVYVHQRRLARVVEREDDGELPLVRGRRHTRRVDLAAVEQLPDAAVLDERPDVLAHGQRLPLRVEELELPGGADEAAHLVLVGGARHLDDDLARAVAARLGADLRLADTDAADAPLDDVARGLDLLIGDRLAARRDDLERDPLPALEVEAEPCAHPVAEQVERQVDDDRQGEDR